MRKCSHWLILLLITDLAFVFLTWIVRAEVIKYVILFIVLFTCMIIFTGFFLENRRRKKILKDVEAFLEKPSEANMNALAEITGSGWSNAIEILYEKLTRQAKQINEKTIELTDYREYIEAWVHEIKTPLFLSSLVIENRKDEMSPYVYDRMHYTQRQLSDEVERILYYARLNADHADYKFTEFRLDDCAAEVISEYKGFADEKHISIQLDLLPCSVISDRKVVVFMLSQIIGNAVKYADADNGRITMSISKEQDKVCLSVYNNGKGIPPEDAPFLFDKGFTGNHPDRQKATGMGLYLVKKYADRLCVDVQLDINDTTEKKFGITLIFTL